ncbi:MAG: type III pantothenate kinase [Saprospiraceae bacterium]
MNLIFDIGNTRTKVALYKGDRLLKKVIWEKCDLKTVKAFVKNRKIDNAALSSTANVSKAVEIFLEKKYFYIRLNHKTHLPITNKYKTPATLGRDRLAGAVAAFDIFPKQNTLVIDAGTCITYDFIDAKGNYLGGGISPGIQMRFKAMDVFTANLPLVKQKNSKKFIGNDTESSLRVGGQMGTVMEIRGFINAYVTTFGKINIILTGGDSKALAKHFENHIFVNNNLVLHGLNKILNYNVQLLE